MIPTDLMEKYKYGYVHSCEILNEPFVKDLIRENKKYKEVIDKLKELNLAINDSDYVYSQDEITKKNLDILKEVE